MWFLMGYLSSQGGYVLGCVKEVLPCFFQQCNDVRAQALYVWGDNPLWIGRDLDNQMHYYIQEPLHIATIFSHEAKPIRTQRPTILQIQKSI